MDLATASLVGVILIPLVLCMLFGAIYGVLGGILLFGGWYRYKSLVHVDELALLKEVKKARADAEKRRLQRQAS